MISRVVVAIFLVVGFVAMADEEMLPLSNDLTIFDPFFSERGELKAKIKNETTKEINLHPVSCIIEARIRNKIERIQAKHPHSISLLPLKIPPGEVRVYSFDLVPNIEELTGQVTLMVYWFDLVRMHGAVAKSEPFEISEIELNSNPKSGATTAE